MNKKLLVIFTLVMALTLSACGEKKPKNAEINLPKKMSQTMFGDKTPEELKELLKGEGIIDVKKDKEGKVTLIMPKEKHEEALKNLKVKTDEFLNGLKENKEMPIVKDLTFDEGYKNIQITILKEAAPSIEGLTPMLSGLIGEFVGIYQVYAGEEMATNITFLGEDGKELDKVAYPKDMEDFLKE